MHRLFNRLRARQTTQCAEDPRPGPVRNTAGPATPDSRTRRVPAGLPAPVSPRRGPQPAQTDAPVAPRSYVQQLLDLERAAPADAGVLRPRAVQTSPAVHASGSTQYMDHQQMRDDGSGTSDLDDTDSYCSQDLDFDPWQETLNESMAQIFSMPPRHEYDDEDADSELDSPQSGSSASTIATASRSTTVPSPSTQRAMPLPSEGDSAGSDTDAETAIPNTFDPRQPASPNDGRPRQPPRLRRADATSGLPGQGFQTNTQAAARPSAQVPSAYRTVNWEFRGENSTDFNIFLSRLRETADYTNTAIQARLIARVDTLIMGMRAAPALRDICFGIATQAIESCCDRIAQGVCDMERARINHDVDVQEHPVAELFLIGEGLFKLKVVDEIADGEIAAQRGAGDDMDEVEIRLAYQIGLHERLDLPAVSASMAYRATANLAPEALDVAEARVRKGLESRESVNFLVAWPPWQRALERDDTDGLYARAHAAQKEERDELVLLPPRTTEGEWIEELAELQQRHTAELNRITMRLTRRFLAAFGDD